MTKRSGNCTERRGSSVFAPGIQPTRSVPPRTGAWAEALVAPASSARTTATATCLGFIVRPPRSLIRLAPSHSTRRASFTSSVRSPRKRPTRGTGCGPQAPRI